MCCKAFLFCPFWNGMEELSPGAVENYCIVRWKAQADRYYFKSRSWACVCFCWHWSENRNLILLSLAADVDKVTQGKTVDALRCWRSIPEEFFILTLLKEMLVGIIIGVMFQYAILQTACLAAVYAIYALALCIVRPFNFRLLTCLYIASNILRSGYLLLLLLWPLISTNTKCSELQSTQSQVSPTNFSFTHSQLFDWIKDFWFFYYHLLTHIAE